MVHMLGKSKRIKYNKIVKESVEGYHKGFNHRIHRTNKNKTGRYKLLNHKKEFIEKEEDDLWQDLKKQINLIGI